MGGPSPQLLRLALPSALFALLTNGYRVVDQYWVDRISVDAQAAVGSTIFLLVVVYAVFEVVSAGLGPLVARFTGADRPTERRVALGAGLWGAGILAIAWALVGGLGAPVLADSLGLDGPARQEATRYLRAIAVTGLPLVLTPSIDQAFLAMGDAKTPLRLHALALVLNLLLTPLAVVALDAGVAGAAFASTGSRAVATGWGLRILTQRTGMQWRRDLRPSRDLKQIIWIGIPMAANTALYGSVYWVMLRVAVSPLGPAVNAALGIGWSALEGISWSLFHGVGLAAASVVGRQLGARDLEGAQATVRASLAPTLVLGFAAMLLFMVGGKTITAPFASDPTVHAVAARYAWIVGLSQVFVALESTAEGVLAGSGDTRGLFWSGAPLNLLRPLLAWWLAFPLGWGADGIWWTLTATTVAKTVLKWLRVRGGQWLRIDVGV